MAENTDQTPAPSEMTDAEKKALVASTRRFDLRRILGALFAVYGVITLIVGIVNYSSDISRTKGIAINLWTGAAMIVLAILFFVWDRLSPVPESDIVHSAELIEEEKEVGEGKKIG